ncbi:monodehydroascorbate reductase [Tanacetum coccineum]
MAEQNVPAQPPTRTDEQIVPRSQWLTIGKSNLLFNAQKIQKNPIFQISVDILKNTNFFQALTASANVPAIYLQQFWKTMSYNEKTGVYSCQLDEQWFDLSADLLRNALAITPVKPTHPFELPPTGDTVLDFVNELGYPEPIEFVSSIRTNYVYQPWRAILSLLNQCLTGKTSGSDKPRHPVLQMLWGIVTQTNIDHAELIWEEFTQGIQTYFSHKASLKNPKKKPTPLLIPYGRFSKVIIYYLARNNNIHRRPDSAIHYTGDDYVLGNLKFVPKGETVEVFGMAIPDPLITEAIQQSPYYPNYLKMVAANTKKTPRESASGQPATKRATPKKTTTTTPVKQTKPAPPPTKKPSKRKLPQKVRKGKLTFKLVDEDDEDRQETIPHEEGNDPDLELAMKLSLETPQEKGEGEGDDADLERAIKLSLDPALLPQGGAPVRGITIREPGSEAVVTEKQVTHSLVNLSKKKRTNEQFVFARHDQTPPDSTTGPSSQPEDDTSEKVVHESSSTSDSDRTESDTESGTPKGDKVQGEIISSTVTSGVSIPVSDPEKAHEAQAGPDPEPMQEDQTGSKSGKLHVSLAGPNPEHMDDEFIATAYPKVHENLKLITGERVINDKPESHSGSMSSLKNLDDTVNFGDQFLHDQPTEDDQEKSKAREEFDSNIPDSSHQTVMSTPPLIAPFTNVTSSEPSLLVTPPPINTEATTITTSLPEITPFIALQLRVAKLEQEMSEVEREVKNDYWRLIRAQVPTAVDKYSRYKLDVSPSVLGDHCRFNREITLCCLSPESIKNHALKRLRRRV